MSFGYEYKLFESFNQVCQTAVEKLVRFMVFRVEYNRSNMDAYKEQAIGLPMQWPRGRG